MAYTSPTWVDGSTNPALSASTLQALTDQVEANQRLYGTANPSTATQGALGQIYGNTSTSEVFVCTKATSPYAWNSFNEFLQAENGTYTGTGTYGSSHQNTLTFDFAPRIVVVQQANYNAYGPIAIVAGATGTICRASSSSEIVVTWTNSGKTVSWYSASSASYQLNTVNTYIYSAIG